MLIKTRIAAALVALAATGGLMTTAAISAQAATHAQTPTAAAAPQYRGMGLQAGLRGSHAYPAVRGHSEYQSGWQGRHMELSLWNARRLAGRTLVIFVHRTRVGTMRIGHGGSGSFSRGRGMPACSPGTVIRVRTQSGALVASGTFHRMM